MNVIASAFAFRPGCGNSMQLGSKNDTEKQNIYIKNIIVTLTSAKLHNPEDEVLLVTNEEPPEYCREQLTKAGVTVRVIPYDDYVMPEEFAWSLAFFKLCTLQYLTGQEYQKILLIDADTYTVEPFTELWQEMDHGIMLYPVNHSYMHHDRDDIRKDAEQLGYGDQGNVIHYGGEFVGGKKEDLSVFMESCRGIFTKIENINYEVRNNIGDETVLSVAAMLYKKKYPVTEAGAYLFRYWTERSFYLVCSNTVYNPVCIWHLPAEKDKGFLLIYRYYMKHGRYPDKRKAAKMFGIYPAERPKGLASLQGRLMRKMSNRRAKRKL